MSDIVARLRALTQEQIHFMPQTSVGICQKGADEIERLRAEVAALRAAAEWRPIESAPKDGTLILIHAPARYDLEPITCPCAWHPDAGFCVDELREPEWWMPLPEPPR